MSRESGSNEELEYATLMELVPTMTTEGRFTPEDVTVLNEEPGRWLISQFFRMVRLAMDGRMEYVMTHQSNNLLSLSDQTTTHLTTLMESGNTEFGRARERDEQLAAAINTVHQGVAQEGHIRRTEDLELAAVIRTQASSLAALEERLIRLEGQKVALREQIEHQENILGVHERTFARKDMEIAELRAKVNGQAAEVTADVKAYFDVHCPHCAHCDC